MENTMDTAAIEVSQQSGGTLADIPDGEKLIQAMENASQVVTKSYMAQLANCDMYDIVNLDKEIADKEIGKCSRLYRIDKFVYQKDESIIDKLSTVFSSAFSAGASVVTLIRSDSEGVKYYIGVVDKRSDGNGREASLGNALEGSIEGNFPGTTLENIEYREINGLAQSLCSEGTVSALSFIPSLRKKESGDVKSYTQGIENMLDATAGQTYTAIMIADPISPAELDTMELGFEQLYSQLSAYAKNVCVFNQSDSLSFSHTDTQSITESITKSVSDSSGTSASSGWNSSLSETAPDRGAIALGGAISVLGGVVGGPLGGIAGGLLGSIITQSGGSTTKSSGTSGQITEQQNHTVTDGTTQGKSESASEGRTESSQHGRSLQISIDNKTVQNMLARIDEHLARIKACRVYGACLCSSYILAGDRETSTAVASGYSALMHGEASAIQASYINTWENGSAECTEIKKYLEKFTHPIFKLHGNDDNALYLSAASLVTGQELAVQAGLPKRSVNGITVMESAPFGRNIYSLEANRPDKTREIPLGKISHMGQVTDTEVNLNLDHLASHVFITGSTGSGKSNAIYHLLNQAMRNNVRFMVVEPAKGEYKKVFGGREGVRVYGTNPNVTELLRLNPFAFPDKIHILEHLDRLVEIFNVCWPMYAAMPAVLKKAMEKSYEACGWDLVTSKNRNGEPLYPTFGDVLRQIFLVVDESAYSGDTKSDYIGSLATRVESLTNGLYKMIFNVNCLPDRELFDQNVIVDLSRIGSQETKALLMGLLVMKLQEYRMTETEETNRALNHITVLEEAHNILKKTSTEQTSEGANLLGKSVEMLANAIAEMRTYGEGFIIADQSPGLMDMSVIRNTNTKMILRLPDYGDRELVGKAIGLNEGQITELSRLSTGTAAVYQNNWLEAVLCKIDYFAHRAPYQYTPAETPRRTDSMEAELLNLLMKKEIFQGDLAAAKALAEKMRTSDISGVVRSDFEAYLRVHPKGGQEKLAALRKLLFDFLDVRQAFAKAEHEDDMATWMSLVIENLSQDIRPYTETQRLKLLGVITDAVAEDDPEYGDLSIRLADLYSESSRKKLK